VGGLEPGAAPAERPAFADVGDDPVALELVRKAEATIAKVTADIGERFSFHTAISAIQELVNLGTKGVSEGTIDTERAREALRYAAQTAASLLFPFAPHVASELWEALGGEGLWRERWPAADPAFLERDTVTVVVQVNGKLRERLEVPVGLPERELVALARELPRVVQAAGGREVVREVVVPDRLVNLVLG
jgi:leucyl-tRNA synthetase